MKLTELENLKSEYLKLSKKRDKQENWILKHYEKANANHTAKLKETTKILTSLKNKIEKLDKEEMNIIQNNLKKIKTF